MATGLSSRTCPKCGAPLPRDAPKGLCPRCLFEQVRPEENTPTEAQSTLVVPQVTLSEGAGNLIDRYKLLEQIGEGGFGSVWMAEQTEPVRRRVALKVIKLGMDTKQVVARFEAERQALAMMDHPNIARVFDGGTTESGRPYFVMELVRGIPITEYCDAQKLSMAERLDLFMQVCQAVQHAHQKGIIHRDLKPSNILVTEQDGQPLPKVIDFGVAKALHQPLTDKTLFTSFQQWIGTPAYMSPEQAGLGGLDIDTRSDIYALGVLLYELLTGRPPFSKEELFKGGVEGVLRMIREQEPPKPSTRLSTLTKEELTALATRRRVEPTKLGRLLRGELDWIVMKALEKDRRRRYETATALAQDLQHHLRQEPVSAVAPTFAYWFFKFARRNRLVFTTAAAVAAALLIGFGVSHYLFAGELLRRWRGGIEIASRPSGAEVWMEGQKVGVTPFRLSQRDQCEVTVMLRLRNYEWFQTTMQIGPSVQQDIIVNFEKTNLPPALEKPPRTVVILETQGKVEVVRSGSTRWDVTYVDQVLYPGDKVRTGQRSRVVIRLSDQSILRVNELSTFFITKTAVGMIRG